MRSKRDIFTVLTSCCTHRNFLISLSVSMANKMLPIRVCRQLPSVLIRRHLRDKNRSVASDDSHLLRHDTLLLLRLPSSQRTDRGAKNEWVIWECFHVFMSNPATRWCPKIQVNVYRSKFSIPNCRLLSLMGFRTVITLLCWPCIMGRQSFSFTGTEKTASCRRTSVTTKKPKWLHHASVSTWRAQNSRFLITFSYAWHDTSANIIN